MADATNWTSNFFETNDVAIANEVNPPPLSIISEVGWPSAGGTLKGSVAGLEELNTFLNSFICTENSKGTAYFWWVALLPSSVLLRRGCANGSKVLGV